MYPLWSTSKISVSDEGKTISGEELSTDYGLHRALNSTAVPNDQNPIANGKECKLETLECAVRWKDGFLYILLTK